MDWSKRIGIYPKESWEIMENNDFEINEKKMLESMANAQELFEKALKLDNENLRKRIESLLKISDKFQENPKKRIVKKLVKRSGVPFEIFAVVLSFMSKIFREVLELNDNELRESIELLVEQGKVSRDFLFGV